MVPRPQRRRRICRAPMFNSFMPEAAVNTDTVTLSLDEYEAIRLVDLEDLTHEQCAARMDISRSTATEIYKSARAKIADCIVNGRKLVIAGGNYRFCGGTAADSCMEQCRYGAGRGVSGLPGPIGRKSGGALRVAVPCEDGQVFGHFGQARQFKVYDAENGEIKAETMVSADGGGRGAQASFLRGIGADVVLCAGIGPGAQSALKEAGIGLVCGAAGDADRAVAAFLRERDSGVPGAES